MKNPNLNLEQEVAMLRAEVRRLRRLLEGAVLMVGVGLMILFPGLLTIGISLAVMILFGFVVSPHRRMILRPLLNRKTSDDIYREG